MIKRLILFDIDGTLVNTKKFSVPIYREIAKILDIPVEKVIEIKDEYKNNLKSNTDYKPNDLLKYISKKTRKSLNNKNPFNNPDNYLKSIYPETISVLKNLSPFYNLGIFSEGFKDYQLKKIELAKIVNFFDKNLIYIERRKLKKEMIDRIANKTIIIDDKKEVIKKLMTKNRFELIWINRNDNGQKIENEKVKTIFNLKELETFLIKNTN